MMEQGAIAALYTKCESQRSPYLMRGRESSRITIPTILTDAGNKSASKYPLSSFRCSPLTPLSSASS